MTGGAGFIGRYCVRSFLGKNFEVTIFDNFSNSSEDKIQALLDAGANLVKGDITVRGEVSNAISGHDVVVHLAAKINVQESFVNPKLTTSVNVDGTINLLEACKENKITDIIVASSAAVYGDCKDSKIHLSENLNTNPTSPYGESKLEMEKNVIDYSEKHGFNAVILRFFNIYGIGQSPEYSGVITKFLQKINEGKSLEIYGDGLQTRDFVSINDIVDSFNDIISKIDSKRGNIYNIASGQSISINDLASLIVSLSGKDLSVIYSTLKKGDINYSQADISLAKKELGFFPKIKLKDGLKKLIKS